MHFIILYPILTQFPRTFYQCDECRQIFYCEEWAWEFSYKHFQQSRCIVVSYLVPVKSVFIKFCLKFLMEILKDKRKIKGLYSLLLIQQFVITSGIHYKQQAGLYSAWTKAAINQWQPRYSHVGVNKSRLTNQVPADIWQPRLNLVCCS